MKILGYLALLGLGMVAGWCASGVLAVNKPSTTQTIDWRGRSLNDAEFTLNGEHLGVGVGGFEVLMNRACLFPPESHLICRMPLPDRSAYDSTYKRHDPLPFADDREWHDFYYKLAGLKQFRHSTAELR